MLVNLAIISMLIVPLVVTINNKIFAEPILKDSSLRAELVVQGLHSPTSNSGNILLVSNGVLQKQPVLKLHVIPH